MLDSVVVRRCHDDDLYSVWNHMCSAEIRRPGSSLLAFAWPGWGVAVAVEGHCCDFPRN